MFKQLFKRSASDRKSFFHRKQRIEILGSVYIKRPGMPTLMGGKGNISASGLYVEVPNHDLEKGRRVEVIAVFEEGNLRLIKRMMGIVVRINEQAVAMVTYKAKDFEVEGFDHDKLYKLEFGELEAQARA